MKELIIKHVKEIHKAAEEFIDYIGKNYPDTKCFAFYGKMGSGKTTFIKALLQQLHVVDNVNSPTFAIINQYTQQNGEPVYHFDFYRINKIEEVYDIGYEEYLYSDYFSFIEWPEIIEEILPQDCLKINITVNNDESRSIIIN